MRSTKMFDGKPFVAALLMCGAVGFAGTGLAQGQPDASQRNSPSAARTTATPIAPSRAEMPDAAFKKLDAGGKGYVTQEDARVLSGFDQAFQANDANHDGKLTAQEFNKAWSQYSGKSN
jgi:hypothetical protein